MAPKQAKKQKDDQGEKKNDKGKEKKIIKKRYGPLVIALLYFLKTYFIIPDIVFNSSLLIIIGQ